MELSFDRNHGSLAQLVSPRLGLYEGEVVLRYYRNIRQFRPATEKPGVSRSRLSRRKYEYKLMGNEDKRAQRKRGKPKGGKNSPIKSDALFLLFSFSISLSPSSFSSSMTSRELYLSM